MSTTRNSGAGRTSASCATFRGAEGAPLDEVLTETDPPARDFVPWREDLTDQVADASGDGDLRTNARVAGDALRRGVVA